MITYFVRLILISVLFFLSCSVSKTNSSIVTTKHAADDLKNGKITIQEYLKDSLWSARDAYDAAHNLIIPLHYAVFYKDEELIEGFENHFSKMLKAYENGEVDLVPLTEMQYLTLLSRYLALDSKLTDRVLKKKLAKFLLEKFKYYWNGSPAWQWSRTPFDGGIKERIKWKLTTENKKQSYHNIILDADMFILGIGVDLYSFAKKNNLEFKICAEVIPLFKQILKDRLNHDKKGWEFQLDYWLDHRDYSYSGFLTKPEENSNPIRVTSIQEDSSHGHRWPLWLMQFSNFVEISEVKRKLKWQLLNIIVDKNLKMGIPILNNFMCGHNGYYRWGFSTHPNTGYGPYELSGTFGFGWWSLLGGDDLSKLYFELYEAYPLNPAQKKLYSEITTRRQHAIMKNSHDNNLRKSLALMAHYVSIKTN